MNKVYENIVQGKCVRTLGGPSNPLSYPKCLAYCELSDLGAHQP